MPADEISSGSATILLQNDSDPDGDTLAIDTIVSELGALVYVDANNQVFYDPTNVAVLQSLSAGQTMKDIVTYTIVDGNGGSASAEVQLTIGAPNNGGNQNTAPVANDDVVYEVLSGDDVSKGATSFLLDNDTDADGDTLVITSFSSAIGAQVYIDDVGEIVYDPTDVAAVKNLTPGQSIDDIVTYTISDGNGGSDSAEVKLTVAAPQQTGAISGGPLIINQIVDEAQYLDGSENVDTFVTASNSSAYQYGAFVENGEQGVFVYNPSNDITDILYDFEKIQFDDVTVEIDQLPVA